MDVFDGTAYRRLLGDPQAPTLLSVEQIAPDALAVRLDGPGALALDPVAVTGRMLGTGVELSAFYAGAASVPWLDRIATAARGVKPPRYPSLWETVGNAVVYQQVSIHAAGANFAAHDRALCSAGRDERRAFVRVPAAAHAAGGRSHRPASGRAVGDKINALKAAAQRSNRASSPNQSSNR